MYNLISESTEEIFSKLTEDEIEMYRTTSFIPKFNENGIFKKVDEKNEVDFKKLMYAKKNKLRTLSSYKISEKILENEIRQISKEDRKFKRVQTVLDIESAIKKTLIGFLTSYFNEKNLKKINTSKFTKTFAKLERYIKSDLYTVFCFVTIRNFDSKIKSMKLPRDLIIRPRTDEEFSVISGMNDDLHHRPNPNFQNIKFVLGTTISKIENDEKKIRKGFEKILFALKILHEGYIQFGGIYYRDSEDWDDIQPTNCKIPEPTISKPTTNYRLEYDNFTEKEFNKLVNELTEINLAKGKYVFLGRSIKRFSQAIENDSDLDKVLDFITCLESLYSSKEQQLSYRFAMRIASFLGQTPKEKIKIQELMLQIYNLRSKIIHGDTIPDVVLDGEVIGSEENMDQCLKILERISRSSIKIFLQLINDYKNKEELHKTIDDSIYDPKLQKLFLKNSKKIKFELEIN